MFDIRAATADDLAGVETASKVSETGSTGVPGTYVARKELAYTIGGQAVNQTGSTSGGKDARLLSTK